jgi:glutamyl-tRNA reductase
VALDEVKNWVLDWPDPLAGATWAAEPSKEGQRILDRMSKWIAAKRATGIFGMYSMHDYFLVSQWRSDRGFGQADLKDILDDPKLLTAAGRKQLRRIAAYQAYVAAAARGTAGPRLSWVFLRSLKVGKQVRTDTNISRNAVSISHAAVELAKKLFGGLVGRSVLLIGAGEMAEVAARNLMDNGCTSLVVTNRTYDKACELANRYGGSAVEFEGLQRLLAETDIVLTCTGAPTFILSPDMVQAALRQRPGRPLFLIDIAVPRDVDPEVGRVDGVFLHDIDDLQSVCAANLEERQREVAAARQIIDAEVEAFSNWWNSLQVVPTIRALRDRAESIQQAELQKALSRLGNISDRQRSTVEAMAAGIVNKILHQPTVRLKSCCDGDSGAAYAMTLRELFGLEAGAEMAPVSPREQRVD